MKMVFILMSILMASMSDAIIVPSRCGTLGDSLDHTAAAGRRSWAWKCFPDKRPLIQLHAEMKEGEKSYPGYPTFAYVNDQGSVLNPQQWYAPIEASASCYMPSGYMLVSYCAAGCYTPEQYILSYVGDRSIEWIYNRYQTHTDFRVMSVDQSSTIDSLLYQAREIEYVMTDLVEGQNEILNFETVSGGTLRVTLEHPLLDEDGYMRWAKTFRVGDNLVRGSGELDGIRKIETQIYFGKVYNLETKSENPKEKIIIAQGFLNGTHYFQEIDLQKINRAILRRELIPDFLVQ